MQKNIPDIDFNRKLCTRDFKVMSFDEFFKLKKEQVDFYNVFQPHRLRFFQMLYVTDGIGKHMVDFEYISLKKGSLLFSYPSQVQAFSSLQDCKGYICIFTQQFLEKEFLQISDRHIIDNLYLNDITKAFLVENDSLRVYFELLYKEFLQSNESKKEDIPVSLLRVILHKSREKLSNVSNDTSSELFSKFKRLILSQFYEVHNVQEYASLLNVSSKHLNVVCKEFSGLSTKAFIDHFKIVEIKRFLASSTLPIKDIAVNVGYWEVSNFIKFFKKHTGETPKVFRDSHYVA